MATGAEIASLKWVADFLKAVLTAVAGDRLKKRSSAEKAIFYAIDAYRALVDLDKASTRFVSALQQLPDEKAQVVLPMAVDDVNNQLGILTRALNKIQPQLEIHAPNVTYHAISSYAGRSIVVSDASTLIAEFAQGKRPNGVSAVIREAVRSKAQIEEAVESLRVFIAREFTFKESF